MNGEKALRRVLDFAWENQEDRDLIFICNGGSVKTHKFIISMHKSFIYDLLQINDDPKTCICLIDTDLREMQDALKAIYKDCDFNLFNTLLWEYSFDKCFNYPSQLKSKKMRSSSVCLEDSDDSPPIDDDDEDHLPLKRIKTEVKSEHFEDEEEEDSDEKKQLGKSKIIYSCMYCPDDETEYLNRNDLLNHWTENLCIPAQDEKCIKLKEMTGILCKFETCGQTLNNNEDAKKHIAKHVDNETRCPFCQTEYKTTKTCVQHIFQKHHEIKFICPFPDCLLFTFKSRDIVKRHKNEKHLGRREKCVQCGQIFTNRFKYKYHVVNIHGPKKKNLQDTKQTPILEI